MALTDYKSSTSLIPIVKLELDELREAMKKMYALMGGEHFLTEASHHVYENLDGYFKSRLQELEVRVYVKPYGKEKECPHPDPTFLRNLFYAKVNAASLKCKQYNFDLCYYFAFGITRQQYTANKRAKDGASANGPQLRVVVSSLSQYTREIDSIQNYMEVKIGRAVERDVRDVKAPNIGPLFTFHSSQDNSETPTIYLVGKDHFFNENFVLDFVRLSRELKNEFRMNARIVFLDDVWQGEYNVNNSAGIVRITQHWHSHIEFMEEQAKKRKGKKIAAEYKGVAKKAIADMRESKEKTKLIIQEIPPLIEFLLKEMQSMPYNYFMNNVTKDYVIKWLNTKGAA